MHTQTKSMHLKWHQLRFQQNLSISTGIIAIKHWPYKANFNIRISPKYQWWFFFRMRPAAMLRCAGAAAIPQLLGMGWSGLCGVPRMVRAWYIPAQCGPLSAQERHTDMLLRSWGHSGTCRPQRYMLAPKRPTPVRRPFRVTHSLLGRSAPGGMVLPGGMVNCVGFVVSCQSFCHFSIRWKLEAASNPAWRLKGRRERRRWRPRFWALETRAYRGGCLSLPKLLQLLGNFRWKISSINVLSTAATSPEHPYAGRSSHV